MSEPTFYQADTSGIAFTNERLRIESMLADLKSMGVLVPVEPDYEAAAEVLQSGDDLITSWLMWATTIVDAALGIGDNDE